MLWCWEPGKSPPLSARVFAGQPPWQGHQGSGVCLPLPAAGQDGVRLGRWVGLPPSPLELPCGQAQPRARLSLDSFGPLHGPRRRCCRYLPSRKETEAQRGSGAGLRSCSWWWEGAATGLRAVLSPCPSRQLSQLLCSPLPPQTGSQPGSGPVFRNALLDAVAGLLLLCYFPWE